MHIELASTDIPASADFYRQHFDWPIETFQPMDYTMTAFPHGETALASTPIKQDQGVKRGDVLVYIDVADIVIIIAKAKELGATILME